MNKLILAGLAIGLVLSLCPTAKAEISVKNIELLRTLPIDRELQDEFIEHYDEIREWVLNRALAQPTAGRASVACLGCRIIMQIAFTLMRFQGVDLDALLNMFQTLGCIILDLAANLHDDVCKGALEIFIHDVHHIISGNPALQPLDICGIMLGKEGNCPNGTLEFNNWKINIKGSKPPLEQTPYLPAETQSVKILHLTDIHLDLDYVVGKNTDCGKPMCCQHVEENGATPETSAGPHGDYQCDMPQSALNELLETAATKAGYDYEFVIMTGDIPPHNVWNTTVDGNLLHFSAVNEKLIQLFSQQRNVPVYPVIGNHEPHPCNLFPPPSVWEIKNGIFDKSWMYNAIANAYADQIKDPVALAQFKEAGYYTIKHKDTNLRLVVINSNFCYTLNFWLYYQLKDPQGQLQWLADVLAQAEDANERVYIVGHIPPGKSDCWGTWSTKFEEIVIRFESIIMAQFYGHTHNDETAIFYDSSENPPRPANLLFIGASTTAYTDINPGYKVFYADGSRTTGATWEIMDHETWIYNLTEANLAGSDGPMPWEKLYSAKDAFNMASMRPTDVDDMVYRMLFDDSLFQKYWRFYQKDSHVKNPCEADDDACKFNYICDIVIANSADHSHCERFKAYLIEGPVTRTTTPRTEITTGSPGAASTFFVSIFVILTSLICTMS